VRWSLEARDQSAGTIASRKNLRRSRLALAEPLPNDNCNTDPDLAAVVATWPSLPEAIKAGILAMVKAVSSRKDG